MDFVLPILGTICGGLTISLIVRVLNRRDPWLTSLALVITCSFSLTLLVLRVEHGLSDNQLSAFAIRVLFSAVIPGVPLALLICRVVRQPKFRTAWIAATMVFSLLLLLVVSLSGLFSLA